MTISSATSDSSPAGEAIKIISDSDRAQLKGRVGIFGGSFNPLHIGHIHCIQSVHKRIGLDTICVVPASQNPLKSVEQTESNPLTVEQRLDMLQAGLQGLEKFVLVDDLELKRGGLSYTIETVREYSRSVQPEDLYLIIGQDQFDEFDTWKDYQELLKLANLIVVSRSGRRFPSRVEDLPAGLRPLIDEFDRAYISLQTGRGIELLRLKEVDVSATDIRRRLRTGRNVSAQLTLTIENFIRDRNLYPPLADRIGDYEKFTRFCAKHLSDRKAIQLRGFDLGNMEAPSDYVLVASGTSTRHASGLAEALMREVKQEYNVLPQSVEGLNEGRWVLLDYGGLIIHIFYDFVRQEYRLESMWSQAKPLDL